MNKVINKDTKKKKKVEMTEEDKQAMDQLIAFGNELFEEANREHKLYNDYINSK